MPKPRKSSTSSALRTINLEAGKPLVHEAISQLERELSLAREQRCSIVKLIHGYGSSGVGGDIRIAVQKRLRELQDHWFVSYIEDLIQGLVLCMTKDAARNQIFNLTFGSSRSLNQMAGLLEQYFPGIELVHHPRDRLMPERGTLCVDKARDLLGYDPQFPLERGYVSYIKWYKQLADRQPELFDLQPREAVRVVG